MKDEQANRPRFGLWHLTTFGLAFMAPGLSLLATFSLVLVAGYTWAGIPLAYLFAGIAVILTAVSYGGLSKVYPKGGSVWTFSKEVMGPKFAQFAIWIYLLMLLVVPAAALVPVGFFVQDWLGIPPWITVLIGFALITWIALQGITPSFRTILILFLIQVAILLFFAISSIIWSSDMNLFQGMSVTALSPSGSLFGMVGIIIGAAVAVYSFIGFDSPVTMADEAKNPKKTVPWAPILAAVLGTLLNVFLAWAFVLAIPTKGLFSLLYYVNPVPAMAGVVWNGLPPFYSNWQHLLNFAGILAGITGALACLTATSQVLHKMSTDGLLPRPFQVTSRRGVPTMAILVVALIGLLLGEFVPWEVIAYTIAAGAIPTFIIVNFLAFWQHRKSWSWSGILLYKILAWAGILLCSWFIATGLPTHIKLLLMLWVLVGIFLVFLNDILRPQLFVRLANQPENKAKSKSWSWWGLGLSTLALIVGAVIVSIWSHYYGGGISWWHIKAPYTMGDTLATVVVIVLSIALAFIIAREGLNAHKQVEGGA